MAYRKYTTSAAGNPTAAVIPTKDGDGRPTDGYIGHILIIASADTSVAVTIADSIGNIIVLSSTDFTTATGSANQNYKHDSASIVRNTIVGQLTVTISGNGSGTVTVYVFYRPWHEDKS